MFEPLVMGLIELILKQTTIALVIKRLVFKSTHHKFPEPKVTCSIA